MQFDSGYSEEDHLGKPYDIKLLRRLSPFLSPYRLLLTGSVLLVMAITLLELALPYFTKVAIDRYIVPVEENVSSQTSSSKKGSSRSVAVNDQEDAVQSVIERYPDYFEKQAGKVRIVLEDLNHIAPEDRLVLRRDDLAGLSLVVLFYLLVVVSDFFCNFAQRMLMEYAGHRVMHDVRIHLYSHLQQQAMAFFNRQPVARLVTRVTNDVQNMHELFTRFIALVFKDFFLLGGIAVVLLTLDWRLALGGFSVLPLVAWATRRFSSRARNIFRALRVKVAEINTRMSESIEGIKTIQSFGQETANYAHFADLNAENYRLGMDSIHIFAIFMPMIEVLGIVAVAILMLYGGWHVLNGIISLGTLVASLTYMRMFFRPLRDLAENYNLLQNAMASAERIFGLLDTDERLPQTLISESERSASVGEISQGMLEVDQVAFSYVPGEDILQDVSFTVRPGETLAIVGPTGAGKTSLLNLILRLYDPNRGDIRLNGRSLRLWDVGRLRSMMALVPQEPILFSGTLRQNIFPNGEGGDRDTDAAQRIVAAANCTDLMARLPQGLDTPLVKGGGGLSSGERQLVAMARAMARDPQIILLDEATSYIDSQTESAIHKALQNLMQGRTAIIVAHRLSTARSADKIVVIKNGRVAESGGHDQLMAQRGLYWRLNRQSNH